MHTAVTHRLQYWNTQVSHVIRTTGLQYWNTQVSHVIRTYVRTSSQFCMRLHPSIQPCHHVSGRCLQCGTRHHKMTLLLRYATHTTPHHTTPHHTTPHHTTPHRTCTYVRTHVYADTDICNNCYHNNSLTTYHEDMHVMVLYTCTYVRTYIHPYLLSGLFASKFFNFFSQNGCLHMLWWTNSISNSPILREHL